MRRWRRLLVALVLVLAALARPAPASSLSQAEWSTRYWAWAYGLDGDSMWRVALCESGGAPWAENPSGAAGLFQVKPATWRLLVQAENADTALAPRLSSYDPEGRSVWDPDAAAHIAAWAWAHGYGGWWECQP